ncbi:rCG32468, isoform CRA_c, partial [Rattus norvegicus]
MLSSPNFTFIVEICSVYAPAKCCLAKKVLNKTVRNA